MTDMDYLDDETEGKKSGHDAFVAGTPAKYRRHPKKQHFVLKRVDKNDWKVLGPMSENPYAAGYILGWEEAAKTQEKSRKTELLKALEGASSLMEKLKQEPAVDMSKDPYRVDAVVLDYPKHLTPILTVFRQKENIRNGYDDGKKERTNGQSCAYMINDKKEVFERSSGKWQACKKPYVYVKGYLSGWNGEKEPDGLLRTSVKAETLTSEQADPDIISQNTFGWLDGAAAREVFGSLTSVKPPYVFKNRKLFAYVTKDTWQTEYVPLENPLQYAYAAAFIKSWKKWEKVHLKEREKEKPVRKTRKMRQYDLPFKKRERS